MNISRSLRFLASVAVYVAAIAIASDAGVVSVEATEVAAGGKMPMLGGAATSGNVIPAAPASQFAPRTPCPGSKKPKPQPQPQPQPNPAGPAGPAPLPVPVPTPGAAPGPVPGPGPASPAGPANPANPAGPADPAPVPGYDPQPQPQPQPQPGNPSQTLPPNGPSPQPTVAPTPAPTPAPAIPVVPGPAQRCSVHGDPHVSTFDNRAFDFMTTGVFRMVQAGHAQVQVFQEPCDPSPRGRRDLTCARGAAISYGSSIVRLFIQNEKLVVARGPSLSNVLSVHRLSGKTDSYRVFLAVDPTHTSFVDVSLHPWQAGNPLLNVVAQLSATMRQAHGGIVGGICGQRQRQASRRRSQGPGPGDDAVGEHERQPLYVCGR
ncbi:hypothetical protein PINS_up016058 [Pythium insidiosum]|nr:hypothetical protein PINS_up016058 [Pythium insidiosum]